MRPGTYCAHSNTLEVGASNWSDLGAAIEAFKNSSGVYYGGPLGNQRNATTREAFTPNFRLSEDNISYAYLNVMHILFELNCSDLKYNADPNPNTAPDMKVTLAPLSLTRTVVIRQRHVCAHFLNTTSGRMQPCGRSASLVRVTFLPLATANTHPRQV